MKTFLLSTAYLPNIQYFSKILSPNGALIEVHDTYQKQSYRNRTTIFGANGHQILVIPVKRPHGNKTKTCDVLLDYDIPWMANHWKSIISAYKHSPFFEIFEAELYPFYTKSLKYLVDWNQMLTEGLLSMVGIKLVTRFTEEFIPLINNSFSDLRDCIHPKSRMQKDDPSFISPSYQQVFSEKLGFQKNLSFIDLLFNTGPDATFLCRQSLKKGGNYTERP